MRATLSLVVASALATMALSCRVNDYCINNCAAGDGGVTDGDGAPTDGDGGPPTDGDGGQCIVTGTEVCDNKDNDCDGATDEGQLPQVGDNCDNQTGACAGGVFQCTAGAITCSKNPQPEQCDLIDNDCNGMTDEGDPGGGAKCGTDQGECVRGTLHCNTTTGQITCGLRCGTVNALDCPIGGATAPFGVAETCNAKDDDCDGDFDEDVPVFGNCSGGPGADPNAGECQQGDLICDGAGGTICAPKAGQPNPAGPTFEGCDTKDNDCDGGTDEETDLDNDPTNCGACGFVCTLPNAFEGCSSQQCTVAACEDTFHDNNGQPNDGCEFGPCTITGSVEVCNGVDDDCNPATGNNPPAPCGNCAETIAPPDNFCLTLGACAGASASCQGTLGFRCSYSSDVSQDAGGNVVPETECDDIDNDCDGLIDEAQFGGPSDGIPDRDDPCVEDGTLGTVNKQGVCRGSGTVQCPASGLGPARCVIDDPGQPAGDPAETCDGLDNDCDGPVDEGANLGTLAGQEWVDIPLTTPTQQIMKYEASRTDASATAQGSNQAFACSKPGVQPWTNITQPSAEAICSGVGGRLCSEAEWQLMCMPHTVYPAAGVPGPATAGETDFVFIEAEDAIARTSIGGRPWVQVSPTSLNGTTMMQVAENGFFVSFATNALASSSRLDFRFDLAASTTYFPWVRMRSPTTATLAQGTHTAPTATLAPTSAASVAVGDLVIVTTYTVGNGTPTHTLQSGFTQVVSQSQDEGGSPDSRLSIAFTVATIAGAQTYQAYTSSGGTSFTGLTVLQAGTYDTNGISALSNTSNTNGSDANPPTGFSTGTAAFFAVGAYNFQNGAANPSITAPTGFAELWEVGNSQLAELSMAVLASSGTVNPGAFGDGGAAHSASAAAVLVVPLSRSRTVFVGLNPGTSAGNASSAGHVSIRPENQTVWGVGPGLATTAAGTYTLSLYTREDGAFVDTIGLARQNVVSPTFDNAWAFGTNPRVEQATTCNTDDFDTTPGGTDQDDVLATGSRPVCFADQTGANDAFDLTGNVKEWTAQRSDAVNPLRGGAANNEVSGATCQINFSVADDDFFFPNVGFRCCRAKP